MSDLAILTGITVTFFQIVNTKAEYAESFKKICEMLKPGGLFFFTCASTGRLEHGTRRQGSLSSYGTRAQLKDMQDYYKNLTISDFNESKNLNQSFSLWRSYQYSDPMDLYFVGIKSGFTTINDIPPHSPSASADYPSPLLLLSSSSANLS